MGKAKKQIAGAFRIRLTEFALKNIDEIVGYISFIDHKPLTAIRVGDRIMQTIDRIAQTPFAFRECEELRTKTKLYRRAVCMSWSIVYKVISENIIILGVVHNSRRPSSVKMLKKIK